MKPEKILIIRFSSIGDVVQCLSIPAKLKAQFPQAEIHWLTRQDMTKLIEPHPEVDQVWAVSRKSGLKEVFQMALKLRKQNYSRVFDVHNNTRSNLVNFVLRSFFSNQFFIQRSVKRWKRILLFKFRLNTFEQPFSGQRDMIEPLEKWGISKALPPTPQFFIDPSASLEAERILGNIKSFVALAPSAAYFLKRWPKDYFKKLIEIMPDTNFVCLGGPEDAFIEDIIQVAPDRVINLAGKCKLDVSAAIIARAQVLVANDTGLMHIGEQLGKPVIALMGPAPFGFPSRTPQTTILERTLSCRPCSKHGQGPCKNKSYHACMMEITPAEVALQLQRKIKSAT